VSESFRAPPTWPVMAFFLARGWTLMEKVTPSAVSRKIGKVLTAPSHDQNHKAHDENRDSDRKINHEVTKTAIGRNGLPVSREGFSNHYQDVMVFILQSRDSFVP